MAPPTSFSNLPQIIPPQQQAPDTGTQLNSLATGAAQRQLMGQQTQLAQQQVQDLATDNQSKQLMLQSQRNSMAFLADPANNAGQVLSQAAANGTLPSIPGVLPAHTAELVKLYQGLKTTSLAQTAEQNKNEETYTNLYQNSVKGVTDQPSLDAANQQFYAQGGPKNYPVIAAWPADPVAFKAHVGSLGLISVANDQNAKEAETAKTQAQTSDLDRKSAIEEFQTALNPATGVVDDPAAVAKLKQDHPNIAFPTTAVGSKQFIGSQVPVAEQPKYGMANLEFQNASSITPQTIHARAVAMFNPDNYSDPAMKAMVTQEGQTAEQQANAAIPLGTAAVNKAFTDSSDRVGRTTASVAQAKATVPVKISVASGVEAAKNAQSGLTPDAIDMLSDSYRKTGQMPAMGMRNAYAMRQVIDAAAAKGPLDIASEGAAFKANTASLTGLVKQRDSVTAFENTAGKNLDLLLSQARGVMDTGSPLLNQPLRSLASNAFGDANVAAYNAARQVAVNEVAKVTSNPGLSGSLSDSARHEVEAFNPANATMAQTIHVAQVLRQDMANRHQAYNEQIGDIQRRIGQGGTVQDRQAPGGQSPTLPNGGGKTIDPATAQQFYQAAGNDPVKARALAQRSGWKF
jgi:hypothetical protein